MTDLLHATDLPPPESFSDLCVRLEHFETPAWAVRAILNKEILTQWVFDPCSGTGILGTAAVEAGWHTLRAPTHQKCELSELCLMKLLIDGLPRLTQRVEGRDANEWRIAAKIRQELGQDVGRYIDDKQRAVGTLERLREQANKLCTEIEQLRDSREAIQEEYRAHALRDLRRHEEYAQHPIVLLHEQLGLEGDVNGFTVKNRLEQLLMLISEDGRIKAARQALTQVERDVKQALENIGVRA